MNIHSEPRCEFGRVKNCVKAAPPKVLPKHVAISPPHPAPPHHSAAPLPPSHHVAPPPVHLAAVLPPVIHAPYVEPPMPPPPPHFYTPPTGPPVTSTIHVPGGGHPLTAPELNAGAGLTAIMLLAGILAILADGRKRKRDYRLAIGKQHLV